MNTLALDPSGPKFTSVSMQPTSLLLVSKQLGVFLITVGSRNSWRGVREYQLCIIQKTWNIWRRREGQTVWTKSYTAWT